MAAELPEIIAARVAAQVAPLAGKCRVIGAGGEVGQSGITPPALLVFERALKPREDDVAGGLGHTQQTIDVQVMTVLLIAGSAADAEAAPPARILAAVRDDIIDALFGWTPSVAGGRVHAPLTLGEGSVDRHDDSGVLRWWQVFATHHILSA